ncbi:MAG: disulfide bond formation protein DsbA [Rhodospirillaceae bacterium]|jgi:predicted DsbA family dithiol-disulfide isomerase|nr:disulfide bond formation protein DsbA [Rhodospirillaceae bacterium]|tara:strand:+ start:12114 stop:12752 length:639 start_codon:yes stop_codon:yes gene_type:complete
MEIDIIFDTVCPWCYIGKRRLEMALSMRPQIRVKPNWRPFLLNPEMPPEGIDRTAYLVKKFGSESRVSRIYGAIGEAGQSVEIDFAFDRIGKTPNSVDSHRLVRFAHKRGLADEVAEALFVEFFINGRDIGDLRVLTEIGAANGLDAREVEAYLDTDADVSTIHDENVRAHRLGINGVPSFAFNGKFVISGAQEPQVLARMLDAALATEDAA